MLCGRSQCQAGFTLIEMAVVLAVIALVIGCVLVGKSLIHNAELQSVISDVNRFRQAAKMFREKYHYLPGDFPRAEEFWGALAGCPETVTSELRTENTCDGTGDGYIGGIQPPPTPSAITGTAQEVREPIRAWQHLANAGFIEGAYSGTEAPGTMGGLTPGLNIPGGPIMGSGYTLHFASPYVDWDATLDAYPAEYGHILVFGCAKCPILGGLFLGVGSPAARAFLTPEDALWIDQKSDDAKPGTGKVLSYRPTIVQVSTNCTTSDSASSAAYKTQYKQRACPLIFITGL